MTQEAYPQGKTSATRALIETTRKRPLEVLLNAYHAAGWTQGRIAEELGVSRASVCRWYAEFGIETSRGRRAA